MTRTSLLTTIAAAALFISPISTPAQEPVKEPSTGKSFPAEVKVSYGGADYTLKVTGLTVRKKVFFKVYGMAHYMQDPVAGSKQEAFKTILTDGKAKQITMDFARDVDVAKIQDAYKDGFREHASTDEFTKLQPLIDRFTGYFSRDLKENDKYVLRWLPGGTILASIQGEEKPAITDVTFARVLWSIWFGEGSIVDRDDLVSTMTVH